MRWRAAVAAVLLAMCASGCAIGYGYQRFTGPHGQRMARVSCKEEIFGQPRCYEYGREACSGGNFDVLINSPAGAQAPSEAKSAPASAVEQVDPLGARSTMLLVPSAPNTFVVMCVDGDGNAVQSKKAAAEQR